MAYEWRENNACVATYKVLELDSFLDQFEDADVSFSKAATLKIGQLRYFPKTTSNAAIIEALSIEMARNFLRDVTKLYTVKKQIPANTSASILRALAAVFAKSTATLTDLAAILDANVKFPDEA